MKELNISLIELPGSVHDEIHEYASAKRLKIEVDSIGWGESRHILGNYALYSKGPEISTTGMHLIPHLMNMNALQPFTPMDIQQIGGKDGFLESTWDIGVSRNNVYAIPFTLDVRVIYYRKDVLAKAGVAEKEAFSSVEAMDATFQAIKASGHALPLAIPTQNELLVMQNVAMWVWGNNGSFMAEEGHETQFIFPESLAGIRNHYDVFGRALTPAAQNLSQLDCINEFIEGRAATIIAGPWLFHSIFSKQAAPEVIENLGIESIPLPSFVGGQCLVLWRHAHSLIAARELIGHLVDESIQFKMFKNTGELPAKISLLKNSDFMAPEFAAAFIEGFETGRGFQAQYLWGLVEDRLSPAFHHLWQMYFENPDMNLETAISDFLTPLATRLDKMLKS